ncbi:48_t:CDS:2, partial [Ambispora gerdemannii]
NSKRIPPYSGKTSLTQLKEIIGVNWAEWIKQCRQILTILILDEIQMIFKQERGIDESSETVRMYSGKLTFDSCRDTTIDLVDIKFIVEESKGCVERYCRKHFRLALRTSQTLVDIFKNDRGTCGFGFSHIAIYKKRNGATDSGKCVDFQRHFYVHEFMCTTIDRCCASPKVKSLSPEQLQICQMAYTNKEMSFNPDNISIQRLVKSGILVVDGEHLFFSAPLMKRSFFQQQCAIDKMEKFQRDAWIWSRWTPFRSFLRDSRDMAEHSRRFETAGENEEIVRYAKSIAIIDIRSESKKIRKLHKDFIHVSCFEDYVTFKIECLDKEPLIVKIQD